MAERNSRGRLGRALLIWGLILLCLFGAGLFLLREFLTEYEAAGPEEALRGWLAALDDEKAYALAAESLQVFDSRIAPPEEIFARCVKPCLARGLRALRVSDECSDAQEVYVLCASDTAVGRLVLKPAGEGRFGVPLWRVAEESLDFSFLSGSGPRSVTVPEDCSVLCNGYTLDESYVTARRERWGGLDYLLDEGYALPVLVTYTVPDCPLTAELRVFDASGAELDADADFEALLKERCLNSCSAEEAERLESFVQSYAEAYVAFMGGRKTSFGAGYRRMRALVLPGSELDWRFDAVRKGMSWTHNRRNVLEDVEIRAMIRLGEGEYVCDFGFPIAVQTLDGEVLVDMNERLFVTERDGRLYAYAMLSY